MLCILDDLLAKSEEHREKVAIVDGAVRLAYPAFAAGVETVSSNLAARGIRKGDRVVFFLRTSAELAVGLFAAWRLGAVAVVANHFLKRPQVLYITGHAEAALLVTSPDLARELGEGDDVRPGVVLIDALYEPCAPGHRSRVIGDDLAMIIYTSGSTGLPKGIMLSHGNLLAGATIVSSYLELGKQDILAGLLPFSFDYGLNQLLTAVLVGGTLVIERSPFAADVCNTLLRERVTGLAGVPMIWQALCHPRSPFLNTVFPSLRYVTNTGGRMPEYVTRRIREAHPDVKVFLMYGLTEAFRSTYLPPHQAAIRPSSIGKAIPNVEISILNDRGEECEPGETGELVHRGGTVSMGYWRDPEETARRFRPFPASVRRGGLPEMAVFSGDYAKRDEEGYLYYVGRKDSLIKSRGMRVSPDEIESNIMGSGLVMHAVAFAVPSDQIEDDIVVSVVPIDPGEFRTVDLLRFCKSAMPEYMIPKHIDVLRELKRTPTGKPDRVGTRAEYLARRAGTA